MGFRKCPRTLRKYGWCGVLALVYACGLPMPSSESGFDDLLRDMQRIIGKNKPTWKKTVNQKRNKNRGGINLTETLLVLQHYSTKCNHSISRIKADGVNINVKAWLKRIPAQGRYIVHTGRHAVFLDVPSVRGRWKLYDQSGVKRKKDMVTMKGKGGLLLQKVHAVFTITEKSEAN